MPKPIISEELILIEPGLDIQTPEAVITVLCERLVEEGYVGPSYLQATLDRERQFPTGLPTLPHPTAIPHAEADGAINTGVAIAVLGHPVPFQAMDSPTESMDVRIVLLLAVADSANQVSMLQWVCTLVQDQSVVEALSSAKSPSEVMAILAPLIEHI